jgi:hypothetical protein
VLLSHDHHDDNLDERFQWLALGIATEVAT